MTYKKPCSPTPNDLDIIHGRQAEQGEHKQKEERGEPIFASGAVRDREASGAWDIRQGLPRQERRIQRERGHQSHRQGEDPQRRFDRTYQARDLHTPPRVYHRDLKPENLLLDEAGDLKVSDFGLSAVSDQMRQDGLFHTFCGTPAYVAPEVLARKGYDASKVDIWSCGVILFVLMAGYLPFHDQNIMAMYKKIYKGEFRCPRIGGLRKDDVDLNAFDIISFSPGFDLSGLFEEGGGDARFVSGAPVSKIISKLEEIAKVVSFTVRKKDCRVSLEGSREGVKGPLTIAAEIFELTPSLVVVEVKKKGGDKGEYEEFCNRELKPVLQNLNLVVDDSASTPHLPSDTE
ncbi:unnamed protein product, partial [Vitis vinifera]